VGRIGKPEDERCKERKSTQVYIGSSAKDLPKFSQLQGTAEDFLLLMKAWVGVTK
jgi:hypothetical protein